ncbi:MAG: hypothetical protein SFV54_14315 [Bryobacteraceae bacterium]|nr:hypothetical protein [Bryobacteraceae bacterium]
MKLNRDWREFVELLNAHRVEYLVVGAFAVAWHGYPRFTADIDFLVRPDAENAERAVNALRQFGFSSLNIAVEDLSKLDQVIQLGVTPNRIDVITSIAGVSFDEAWASRVHGSIDGVPVCFIGLEELIRNKEATGRLQDRADADRLRKMSTPPYQ